MFRNSSVFRWYDTHYANLISAGRLCALAFALQMSSDYRILLWMFKTLNDNEEFEQFLMLLPGLCD
jgi:hypothetical protein